MGVTHSIIHKPSSRPKKEQFGESMDGGRVVTHYLRINPSHARDIFLPEGSGHLYHQESDSAFDYSEDVTESDEEDEDEILLEEEWNERRRILEDAANLSRFADFYLNPHKPLVSSNPYGFGRNYFCRPSAYEAKTMDGDDDGEEEEEFQCPAQSTEAERIWVADMRLPTLDHENIKQNTIVSPDPSCVVRFGLQYDNN